MTDPLCLFVDKLKPEIAHMPHNILHIIHILPLHLKIIIHFHNCSPHIHQNLIGQKILTIKLLICSIHKSKLNGGRIRRGQNIGIHFKLRVGIEKSLNIDLSEDFSGGSGAVVKGFESAIMSTKWGCCVNGTMRSNDQECIINLTYD